MAEDNDFLQSMIHQPEQDVNRKLDYNRLISDSNNLNKVYEKKPVDYSIKASIERIEKKLGDTGDLPESFLDSDHKVLVESRSGYLTQSLKETRDRLSNYYSICNRLVQPMLAS